MLTLLLCLSGSAAHAAAFGGSPWSIPSRIEAEDFDTGGQGVGYFDSTTGNSGGAYRAEHVDLWDAGSPEGLHVGAIATGEWLQYTVNVAAPGEHLVTLRVATPGNGRSLHLELDGSDVSGPITLPNTGDWTIWQDVTVPVTLVAGPHVLRLAVDKGGFNLNRIDVQASGTTTVAIPTITPNGGTFSASVDVGIATATGGAAIYYTTDGSTPSSASTRYTGPFTLIASATVRAIAVLAGASDSGIASASFTVGSSGSGGSGDQQPFGGTPRPLPGLVEAEDYDVGGEGVAYHDTTTGNAGGVYRTDDVDIWLGGAEGHFIGAIANGEWIEYTVNVASAGAYTLKLRVATPGTGRRLHVEVAGLNVTGTVDLPNTGDWTIWQDVSVPVTLPAGQQVLRLVAERGGFNLSRISAESSGGAVVATPTITPNGGTFSGSVSVSLATTTSGASIYYTTNGSTPSSASALYSGPFTLTSNATVKAIAVLTGASDSAVATASFTVTGPATVATPTITPNGGTFTGSVNVSLATTTSGASIFYTTDGSAPGSASTAYTGPFTLTSSATVRAIAVLSGAIDSAIASASFTITGSGGGQQPFGGSAWPVPGPVEAEDYDVGGEGVAFHDSTGGNAGGVYRTDDVDVWHGGAEGHFVGSIANGEWLEYTVNVASAGAYTLQLRVATPGTGRRLHVEAGGVNVTGTVNLPSTGDWTIWQDVSVPVTLAAGQQVLRVTVERGGFNFSRLQITGGAGSGPELADDFGDGNANGWIVVNGSGTAPSWSVSGGQYRQTNFVGNTGSALTGGYHLGTYAYLQAGAGASNYRFSVTVTPLAASGEEVGVLFYYQNDTNYYRFVTSFADGFTRLERRVGGNFQTLARNARGYPPGTTLTLAVALQNGTIQVAVNGEKLMSAYDTSLSSGTVGLYARDQVAFDDVVVVPVGAAPSIALARPTDFAVLPGTTFPVEATALNPPAGATVAFDLDGGSSSCTAAAQPAPGRFTASCTGAPGSHVLTARLRDAAMALVDSDSHQAVATGGHVYVTIGDSNTWGEGDRFAADGSVGGGWLRALHGYQANLVEKLNGAGGGVNLAFNESVRGDTLIRVLSDRIQDYLERNAGADFAIVLLGTNDAGGSTPLPSGVDCISAGCNDTFKGRLGALLGLLKGAGITPIVVQVPPRWGDGVGAPAFADPAGHPVNGLIAEYNRVIRREDANPLAEFVTGPDLLQYYLTGGRNRFHLFSDNLHLSGLAVEVLAAQLRNVIRGGSTLPFVLEDLCVRLTAGAACASPTPYKQDLLEVGDAPWIDLGSVLTGSIPPALAQGRWIRTAHADRQRANTDFLSFTLDRNATVYVAVDGDAAVPGWLVPAGFVDSGLTLGTNAAGATTLKLFSKAFGAGTVTLGGAAAATTGASTNLLVIVN